MDRQFPALIIHSFYEDGTIIEEYPLSKLPPKIIREAGTPLFSEEAKPIIKQRTCKRCGATWTPRKKKPPVQCPKCKSPYWNRERGKK